MKLPTTQTRARGHVICLACASESAARASRRGGGCGSRRARSRAPPSGRSASASPTTRLTVVEVVGTRSHGSPSRSTPASSTASASRHNGELPLHPVIAITATPRALTISRELQDLGGLAPLREGEDDVARVPPCRHRRAARRRRGRRTRACRSTRTSPPASRRSGRTCPARSRRHGPSVCSSSDSAGAKLEPRGTPGRRPWRSLPSRRCRPAVHRAAVRRGSLRARAAGHSSARRPGSSSVGLDQLTRELVDVHLPRVVVALACRRRRPAGAGSGSAATGR